MDKLTIVLVIAQNGLKTAATALTQKAVKLDAGAGNASDKQEAAKLAKKAQKARDLAKALLAADTGIATYLTAE
jgi:hypothetical protein